MRTNDQGLGENDERWPRRRWSGSFLIQLGMLAFLVLAPMEGNAESGETPGPGSEESAALVALPTPLLRPPAGLEFAPGSPASRASVHLQRAAAIQPLAEQLAEEAVKRFSAKRRGSRRPSEESCVQATSIRLLLTVAQSEITAEFKTGNALMESVSSDVEGVQVLRDLSSRQGDRIRELAKRSRHVDRHIKRWKCRDYGPGEVGALALPLPPRELLGQAVLVEATGPHRVLWLDETPVAASGDLGWAVVIVERPGQRLCESDPRAVKCRDGRVLEGLDSAVLRLSNRDIPRPTDR